MPWSDMTIIIFLLQIYSNIFFTISIADFVQKVSGG